MSRWDGPINFKKYYGRRKYKDLQLNFEKIEYGKEEKQKMLIKIIDYI